MKATKYRVVATVERYGDAATQIPDAGDCAIVERSGVRRQLVMRCPDGCGDILSINLDPRSGPAWRLYSRRGVWSLFPSVDRPTGCLSHFILWRGRITWTDGGNDGGEDEDNFGNMADRAIALLRTRPSIGFVELADELDEIPWDILVVCRRLVGRKLLDEGEGKQRGIFSLRHADRETE